MPAQNSPATQTMTSSDARHNWSRVIDTVARRKARVIVEEDGVPVAAIISAEDLKRLDRMEEQRRHDLAVLEASQAVFAGIPDVELEREVDRALTRTRRQRRNAIKRTVTSA